MGTCPLTELNIVDIDRTSEDPAICQAFCRLEIKYWCRQLINQLSIHQSYIYKLFFRATAGCNFFTHFDNICYLVTSCDTIQTCQVQSVLSVQRRVSLYTKNIIQTLSFLRMDVHCPPLEHGPI